MRGGKKLTGQRFGHWTAIERVGKNERQHALWLCRCDCGAEKIRTTGELSRAAAGSACPECLSRMYADLNRKHGGTGTKLHGTWLAMRKRCLDFNAHNFKNYGGRGIKIFEPWVGDFEAFRDYVLANLGEHPGKDFTLDRINNNGNYEPGNLRWADRKTQMRNRRPSSQWRLRRHPLSQQDAHAAENAPEP